MQHPAEMLKAVLEHPYLPDSCFICACPLDDTNRTAEHVVPRWLQEKYSLWDDELVLLNGTGIPYRQLKIPCCFECNNIRLAPVEDRMKIAFANGIQAVEILPKLDLFRWLAKIFLGIQFKELGLLWDRKSPDSGKILAPDFVRRFAILHFWLQLVSCSDDPEFSPGSVWIFPAQVPPEIPLQFDLQDSAGYGVIALRIGSVVLIADFLENGVHNRISEEWFAPLKTMPLHPVQFNELVAIIAYRAKLLTMRTDCEFWTTPDGLRITWKSTSTAKGNGPLDEWIIEEYAHFLAHFVKRPYDEVYKGDGLTTSWLLNPQGKFTFWSIDQEHPSVSL